MSTFFKALERAEQERALRDAPAPASAPTSPISSVATPNAAPTIPSIESVFTRPKPTAAPLERVSGRADEGSQIEEHLVSLLSPTSFEAEQYRALRHLIEQRQASATLSVIAVSSPSVADGKTTTAINLAGAFAQAQSARVLLIDADLRGADLSAHLGIDEHLGPGLVDAILDPNLTLEAVARPHPYFNLSVIEAGRLPTAPYEVLKSPRVGELLAEARRTYDCIIIDTAPIVSIPDSRIIAKWVDGFLIVVAANRTPRKLFDEALSLIEPEKIVGLVFNSDERHVSRHSYTSQRRRSFQDGTRRKK
ncbi:MAG TPA: CpsD/CapB family tyrosine-protein kinase [Methylomirabilota bacterium]|nr:CpsD/CapB family tyrosine-protein kinase [Methylomirabilota bacterium]